MSKTLKLKLTSIKIAYTSIKQTDIKDINTQSLRAGGVKCMILDRIQRQGNT